MGTHRPDRPFVSPLRIASRIGVLALLVATAACQQPSDPDSDFDPEDFDFQDITLEVTLIGNGAGWVTAPTPFQIQCGKTESQDAVVGGACTDTIVDAGAGGQFSLTATPDTNSTLVGWNGDCKGLACNLSFPPGTDTTFRVIATINLLPPVAIIEQPADDATFAAGDTIHLIGYGLDRKSHNPTHLLGTWTSSLAGVLCTECDSLASVLPTGNHVLTLRVEDSIGTPSSASVSIVVSDEPPDTSPPTAQISGRVTGNGFGVGDATITLSGPVSRSTTSDGTGHYSFAMLPAGTYTIQVSTELNINFSPNPRTVTLAPGQILTVDFAGTY